MLRQLKSNQGIIFMPRLEALIFDLDGTLLDSAPDLHQALNKMLTDNQRREVNLEETKCFVGDGAMAMVKRAFLATGALPEGDIFPYIQQFIGYYRSLPPDPSQIYPEVVETLESYHKAGVALGICTNKQEISTVKILDQLGLKKYFSFIAGGDTFPIHKPNPGHLLGVVQALKVTPHGTVFVGDGHNDIVAAHAAKMPCIVVTHGYGIDNDTPAPDAMIDGFKPLPQVLANLGYSVD